MGIHNHHISKDWEEACIKSRRSIWLRKRRLSMFTIKNSDRVLDLGCGDGLNVSILRKRGVLKIVGLDMSKDLLKEAQKNNPDIKFYLGLAEKLPFKNNRFDVVLVDSVFHHLMEYPKNIAEIKRVLVSGGILCFIEPHDSFIRKMLDFVSTLPISKFVPVLRERSIGYLGEKDLMTHWLETESYFLNLLTRYKFKKIIYKTDLLSIIGQYQKL